MEVLTERKWTIVAAAFITLALALCLTGCGSSSSDTKSEDVPKQEEKQEAVKVEEKTASVGEVVPVTTNYGDLNITVEAFESNEKATQDMLRYNKISESKRVGLLKLVVENVSCKSPDASLPNAIFLNESVSVKGADGVNLSVMNSAFDIDEYTGAAGGYCAVPQGQAIRCALFCPINPTLSEVTVLIHGGYSVSVPVSVA